MSKVFHGELSTFQLFEHGALIFANYWLSAGYSDTETIDRLHQRFPDANLLDLDYVLDLTHRGQQAASELSTLAPGFTNPSSAIPTVPGVRGNGYIVNVNIGEDQDGNPVDIRRLINSDRPLSFDELKELASRELADIIAKYPEDFSKREIKFSDLMDIEVQLAWFGGN